MRYNEYLSGVQKTWKKEDNLIALNQCKLEVVGTIGNIASGDIEQGASNLLVTLVKIGNLAELEYLIESRFEDTFQVPAVNSLNLLGVLGDMLDKCDDIIKLAPQHPDFAQSLLDLTDLVFYIADWKNMAKEDLYLQGLAKL